MHEDFLTEGSTQGIFLGAVHGDPQGFTKAMLFMDRYEPDLLLVEFSPFGRLFRKRRLSAFRKELCVNIREAAHRCGVGFKEALRRPQIRAIARQVSYPFEYRAARAYARRSACRLLLVDYSPFSLKSLLAWPELVSADNLTQLLSMPDRRPSVTDAYKTAARALCRNGSVGPSSLMRERYKESDLLWAKRERFMAEQVRRALCILKPTRPLYLGGWQHLASGGRIPTLRDILNLETAQCRLLPDRSADLSESDISISKSLRLRKEDAI